MNDKYEWSLLGIYNMILFFPFFFLLILDTFRKMTWTCQFWWVSFIIIILRCCFCFWSFFSITHVYFYCFPSLPFLVFFSFFILILHNDRALWKTSLYVFIMFMFIFILLFVCFKAYCVVYIVPMTEQATLYKYEK